MPRPGDQGRRYLPALDGVRAVAVLLVVAYHVGVPGFEGGLLGVGVFFTLSGFLITGLLLQSVRETGRLQLGTFWLRRARRLLPGLLLMLGVVLAVTALTDRTAFAERGREAVGALLYVSNWQTILDGASYFDRVDGPGAFDHLWSLAVEEQFYVVWPVVLAVLLGVFWPRRAVVARVTLGLATASFVALAVVAALGAGGDGTRAYEGTDTRAGGLLLGAALAVVWRPARLPERLSTRARVVVDTAALVGLATVALLVHATSPYSHGLYRGGLLLLSLGTALLVAAVAHPASLVGRALAVAPLRWVGERSYGIYLWLLPVVAFTPEGLLEGAPLLVAALQAGLTVWLAAMSWTLVENPIRKAGLLRAVGLGAGRPARHGRRPRQLLALPSLAAVVVPTLVLSACSFTARRADDVPAGPVVVAAPAVAAGATREPASAAPATSAPAEAAGPRRTSCTAVAHIGDSTSLGLVDPAAQPDPSLRIDARYRAVGATDVRTDVRGARSIVERYHREPNAVDAASGLVRSGFRGCWVVAMGINEVANQQAGGAVRLDARIDRVMAAVGNQPTLWTTVRTRKRSGPYAQAHMGEWNAALARACTRYPSMRVYDWSAEVRPEWYIGDRVHYTTAGYTERGARLAAALAVAFPRGGGPAAGCIVRSGR